MDSKAKRTSAKTQFTRSEKKLKEALLDADSYPISLIERRLDDLKIRWNTVQDAHDEYIQSKLDLPVMRFQVQSNVAFDAISTEWTKVRILRNYIDIF